MARGRMVLEVAPPNLTIFQALSSHITGDPGTRPPLPIASGPCQPPPAPVSSEAAFSMPSRSTITTPTWSITGSPRLTSAGVTGRRSRSSPTVTAGPYGDAITNIKPPGPPALESLRRDNAMITNHSSRVRYARADYYATGRAVTLPDHPGSSEVATQHSTQHNQQ
jgi:hypothetical protein